MLIDSHCHLDFDDLQKDFDRVLIRAKENNIVAMQTICTKISEFEKILSIANSNSNIYCSVGVHPCDVDEEGILESNILLDYTNHNKVIGIGETGLDFYRKNITESQNQISSFINHIDVSRRTGLPIIIHTREAENKTLEILKSEMDKGSFYGVIHCFTGTQEFANEVLDLGFYISISGIITFKNAIDLHNIVKNLPLDRLLIETDSPFLAPIPYRGKTNEPSYIVEIAKFIAELKNTSFENIASKSTENFLNLFTKVRI